MNTCVANVRTDKYDKYIGRPSRWGNPFVIGPDGTRAEVIDKYREYILGNEELLSHLPDLEGKILGCYCHPLPCHGDVLVELLESDYIRSKRKQIFKR
jgi:hypothetical protein